MSTDKEDVTFNYDELISYFNHMIKTILEMDSYSYVLIFLDIFDEYLDKLEVDQSLVKNKTIEEVIKSLIDLLLKLSNSNEEFYVANLIKKRILILADYYPTIVLHYLNNNEKISGYEKMIFQIIEQCAYRILSINEGGKCNVEELWLEIGGIISKVQKKDKIKLYFINLSRHDELRKTAIKDNINLIFNDKNSFYIIELLHKNGLLQDIFPSLVKLAGLRQGQHHKYDAFEHSLKVLDGVERITSHQSILEKDDMRFLGYLKPRDYEKKVKLLKIAALFHDIGKPETMQAINNDISFYHHADRSAELFTSEVANFLLSTSKDIEKVALIIKEHMRLINSLQNYEQNKGQDMKSSFDRKGELKDIHYELMVLYIADMYATGFKHETKKALNFVKELLGGNESDKYYSLPKLIDGEELKKHGYKGKEIGVVLKKIEEKQISGEIVDEKDVLTYLNNLA